MEINVCSCSEALSESAPRYGGVYSDSRLKCVFIEGVHESIRLSIATYWDPQQDVTIWSLVPHVRFLSNIQNGSNSRSKSSNNRMNTRGRQKSLMNFTRKGKALPTMNSEQRCDYASAWETSGKATRRPERRKCRRLDHSTQQRNRLYIALVLT